MLSSLGLTTKDHYWRPPKDHHLEWQLLFQCTRGHGDSLLLCASRQQGETPPWSPFLRPSLFCSLVKPPLASHHLTAQVYILPPYSSITHHATQWDRSSPLQYFHHYSDLQPAWPSISVMPCPLCVSCYPNQTLSALWYAASVLSWNLKV